MVSESSPSWPEQQCLMRSAWYVACRASDLTARPLARKILDLPVVLYRSRGNAVAFVDRCPHRNVPLSLGCSDSEGYLKCSYHGWRFDSAGRCVDVPGKALPLQKDYRVPALPVREQGGLVWVCPVSEGRPRLSPYRPPHAADPQYTTVVREVVAPGSLYDTAENALDVPHTGVLHGGLFRQTRKRTDIVGHVRRYRYWAETQYVGEPPPSGIVARLLSIGTEGQLARVDHWDRFFLPGVLQVEYRLGDSAHFLVTGFLTPEGPHQTRLYAVASFRTPLPGRPLALVLEPFARLIFWQDTRMLRAQSQQLVRFGGATYVSTELDTMGPQMRRLLRHAPRASQASRTDEGFEAGERDEGRRLTAMGGEEGVGGVGSELELPDEDLSEPLYEAEVGLRA